MSTGEPEPGGPPRPKPRPYQPPPGAAKPQAQPAEPAEKPKYQPPPGAVKPTPNMPSGARAAQAAAAQQAASGRPQVGLRGGTFEFSFEHDALLKDLGKNLRTVAWTGLLAAAGLLARFGLPFFDAVRKGEWGSVAEPLVFVLVACLLIYCFFMARNAGVDFDDIVGSQGQDISLLMQALRSMNRLFSSISLTVIALAVVAGLGVVGYVAFRQPEAKPKKTPLAPATKAAAARLDHGDAMTGFFKVPMPSTEAST